MTDTPQTDRLLPQEPRPAQATRCEPPERLREVKGWHWVEVRGLHECLKWRRYSPAHDWRWEYGEGEVAPDSETAQRWLYISPIPSPADVEALVRAARSAEVQFGEYAMHHAAKPDMEKAQRNWDHAKALSAAIAPFKDVP